MNARLLIWPSILAVCLYLSFNIHSKHRIYTYKSPMWADNAGYYVYLPAAFIYGFDAQAVPEGMDTLTGYGFQLRPDGRIYSKYTSGVAILQLPFFAATHLWCKLSGAKADGFSQPYISMMLVSGVFYLVLGMYFLYRALSLRFSWKISAAGVFVLFAATNLYYYGLERNGMSHVYSFCLCSVALYIIISQGICRKSLYLLIPIAAFIILIRPINIMMIPLWLLMTGNGLYTVLAELKQAITWKLLAYGIIVSLLIFLPQLLYWQYLSGGAVFYSYGDEGFTYWKNPKIPEVLFSPNNGFLLYCPLALLCIAGWYHRRYMPRLTAWLLSAAMLLLTYITASWWSWDFGCSYGQRNYIDYYPFFAFGLAAFFSALREKILWVKLAAVCVCIVFIAYNLQFIYNYDDCFTYGSWNYGAWWQILTD